MKTPELSQINWMPPEPGGEPPVGTLDPALVVAGPEKPTTQPNLHEGVKPSLEIILEGVAVARTVGQAALRGVQVAAPFIKQAYLNGTARNHEAAQAERDQHDNERVQKYTEKIHKLEGSLKVHKAIGEVATTTRRVPPETRSHHRKVRRSNRRLEGNMKHAQKNFKLSAQHGAGVPSPTESKIPLEKFIRPGVSRQRKASKEFDKNSRVINKRVYKVNRYKHGGDLAGRTLSRRIEHTRKRAATLPQTRPIHWINPAVVRDTEPKPINWKAPLPGQPYISWKAPQEQPAEPAAEVAPKTEPVPESTNEEASVKEPIKPYLRVVRRQEESTEPDYARLFDESTLLGVEKNIEQTIRDEVHEEQRQRGLDKLPNPEFRELGRSIRESIWSNYFKVEVGKPIPKEVQNSARKKAGKIFGEHKAKERSRK